MAPELVFPLNAAELSPPAEEVGRAQQPSPAIAALTRRLRAGDEAGWREFHGAYAPRLLRYLIVVSGGREELAREALQRTFLRAVRHMREFTSETVFWSWLTVLARSALADEKRRQRRRIGLLERWIRGCTPSTRTDPDRPDPDDLLLNHLEEELDRLPDHARDLLRRKYLGGESLREIAAACQTTEGAIESRLTRARAQLKARLLHRLRHDD